MFETVRALLGSNPEQNPDAKPNAPKKPFRLFEQWGGDNRAYRLAQTVVMWSGIIIVVWIIWG